MTPHNDLPLIKQKLKDRIEDLCRRLLPDGRRVGRLWIAHNPMTGDYKSSPEFKVAVDRDRGAWSDWRSGEKGDVIGLMEYLNRCDFREAVAWARDFTGIRQMPAEQRRALESLVQQESRDTEKK